MLRVGAEADEWVGERCETSAKKYAVDAET